jgi:hypothetical protein
MRNVAVWAAVCVLLVPLTGVGQYSRRRASVATATSGPYSGPAVTFSGTIKALSKKEILIDLDNEDQSLTFRRTGKTAFMKDAQVLKASDVANGMHVVIDATREGDQKLAALKVTVAARAPQPAPQAAK